MSTKISFPSRSNAFSAVKTTSLRRDSIQPGIDQNGVKRIKLSFAPGPARPAFDPDQALKTLTSTFPTILADKPLPAGQTLESLFKICQNLVSPPIKPDPVSSNAWQKTSHAIYNEAVGQLEKSPTVIGKDLRASLLAGGDSVKGTAFLRLILNKWTAWERCSNRLNSVLLHLDRTFVLQTAGTDPLRSVAQRTFREAVLSEKIIQERYLQAIVSWINGDRERHDLSSDGTAGPLSELDQIDRNVVRSFITFTNHLGASSPIIDAYLQSTTDYYAKAVNEQAPSTKNTAGMADQQEKLYTRYISWVSDKGLQEKGRCQDLFGDETLPTGAVVPGGRDEVWKSIKSELRATLVKGSIVGMTQSALDEAMNASDAETLQKLYVLLDSDGAYKEFRKALSHHVRERATKLISDPANDTKMVATLLDFKRFCESTVDALLTSEPSTLRNDDQLAGPSNRETKRRNALQSEIRDGIKAGVETRQATPAELIAKHLDQTMRKGQGSMSAEAFEKVLDDIVDLVKFTKDKDVFKEFYITQLAKRLLLARSASTEEEINMVKKLQSEYGEEFTTGDAMMKDLSQSEDMNKKFQELRMSTGKDPTNLTVNVLSQGQWPPYKQLGKGWEQFALIPSMQRELDGFEAWYKHTFSGRMLSWRHQHTSVTMTARFPGGNKEIGVSLFQATVLLQFNDVDTLNFEELLARTGIEREELVRTLQSLYALKVTRVLVKRPPGKDVNPTDTFTWNSGFTRDKVRFKINQLQQDLSAEESKQTSEKVFEDRNLTLDAQIVRIMKSKKQLKLQDLINEVIDAVKKLFHPEVKAIKAQVESLIEREYIERNEDHRDVLTYLA